MEERNPTKPKTLWQNALKVVKGENTDALVEQFTSEMTLVAEGLCDDQAKLRRDLESIRQEQDRSAAMIRSEQDAQQRSIDAAVRDMDKRLNELTRRIAVLEARSSEKRKNSEKGRWVRMGLIGQLCVLAGIIGAVAICLMLLR